MLLVLLLLEIEELLNYVIYYIISSRSSNISVIISVVVIIVFTKWIFKSPLFSIYANLGWLSFGPVHRFVMKIEGQIF